MRGLRSVGKAKAGWHAPVPHGNFLSVPTPSEAVPKLKALSENWRTIEANERSCARYLVVRDAVPRPDRLRLRYRNQLDEVVGDIVRNRIAPQRSVLQRWAIYHDIPEPDQGAFPEKAFELLLALNDASASPLWIRPAEFNAWRDRFNPT